MAASAASLSGLTAPHQPDEDQVQTRAAIPASTATAYHSLLTSRQFTLQLEFLCSLASPSYLHHLTLPPSPTQTAPLSQASFLRYLAHIYTTWSQPEYTRFVQFPNGLKFCRLLVESAEFRQLVAQREWQDEMVGELVRYWATWRRESNEG